MMSMSLSRTRVRQKRASPSRESPLPPTRFATAFANLLLAASSGWALRQTGGFSLEGLSLESLECSPTSCRVASAATFTLFLIHAVVGVIRFGNPRYGEALRSAYENTSFLCVVVALPCFAAQFALMYNIPIELAFSLIGLGCATAGSYYLFRLCIPSKCNGEARWAESLRVKFIVAASLIAIVLLSYLKLNFYGMAASLSFFHNFFFTGLTGTVFNIPAVDLFVYQLTFFNVFAVKALLD